MKDGAADAKPNKKDDNKGNNMAEDHVEQVFDPGLAIPDCIPDRNCQNAIE